MKKGLIGAAVIIGGIIISVIVLVKANRNNRETSSVSQLHEASFYKKNDDGTVGCGLCPNRCVLADKQRGLCKVRENIGGTLYSLVYGKPVTINVDPVEKKPLYHFLPGAKAYSLATAGCNLECKFCQNWDISQRKPEELESTPKTPEQVVDEALQSGSQIIAFTYNEPTVWYEYMSDIAKLAHEKNLRTVMISSGYINQEPLKQLLPYLDAVKIDFKSYNSDVYRDLIRGNLEPVLDSIKTVYQSGKWLELVHLVVPGYTDNLEEIKNMCTWIAENTSTDVPVHFSRFFPKFKLLNLPPTPEESVIKAREVCMAAGMKYVYTGNIEDEVGSATYCPDTKQPVITRQGYFITQNLVAKDGKAQNCQSTIPGVWQ
jgi:pyruvate formate lyase activating enzyme